MREGVPVPRTSAGLLLYRLAPGGVCEVLVGHMGGPFWATRDAGAWSIPKGEYESGEVPFDVAKREFEEELGTPVPATEFIALGEMRVTSGKLLTVWAAEGDLDAESSVSNTFELEWPPKSGRIQQFPEIDRSAWLAVPDARIALVAGQVPFLDRLMAHLADLAHEDAGGDGGAHA
jgi:predicted NUDIX family NTP pyrophosphohydrolase